MSGRVWVARSGRGSRRWRPVAGAVWPGAGVAAGSGLAGFSAGSRPVAIVGSGGLAAAGVVAVAGVAGPAPELGLLRAAAERVAAVGLFQGGLWPGAGAGQLCGRDEACSLVGAIAAAAGVWDPEELPLVWEEVPGLAGGLHAVAGLLGVEGVAGVQGWSDAPGRVPGQVVTVLRMAGVAVAGRGRAAIAVGG